MNVIEQIVTYYVNVNINFSLLGYETWGINL